MTQEEILTTVRAAIQRYDMLTRACDIRLSDNLRDDLWLDSLDRANLVIELEDHYHVRVDDSELRGLKTVGDIVGLLKAKTDAAQL